MNFLALIDIAFSALIVNKGRSALTSLGIVIGICAVIAMVAAGAGARDKLDERLESVGKNLLLVRPYGRTSTGVGARLIPFTSEEVQALKDDASLKQLVVGFSESQQMLTNVSSSNIKHHTTVAGGVPVIQQIRKWSVAAGRYYDEGDIKKAAPVCVLCDTAKQKLFPNNPRPIGEKIRIEGLTLEVVGVLHPKGRAPTGADQDDQIFVPITTLQNKIAHEKQISLIVASSRDESTIDAAKQRMTKILREKRNIRQGGDDNFEVSSVQEMAQLAVFMTTTLNYLIVVIAFLSLIVGGIGIMNIMLVSVTERTREIGIRMAVGARPSDIRNQFLLEAVALAMLGGLLGVILGITIAVTVGFWLSWPVYISPFIVALAFGFCALVGVFFGFYPAYKASCLDPIEALRYE